MIRTEEKIVVYTWKYVVVVGFLMYYACCLACSSSSIVLSPIEIVADEEQVYWYY